MNLFSKIIFNLGCLFFIAASFSSCTSDSNIYTTKEGAINGYDPVAFFTEGKPVKGIGEFSYSWNNAKWYFVSEKNRELFSRDPEKYAPQYGGFCAFGCSDGHKAPTDPHAWTIVDDKLYLNYDTSVKSLWSKDREGHIKKADSNWPSLMHE